MSDLIRYPIGQFKRILHLTNEERRNFMKDIPTLVTELRGILTNLNAEFYQIPYRTGGWTIQQIVHHMADNDMNAYIRFKRALTEDEPQASSYREDLWADLNDYRDVPTETSLVLLETLHSRFFILLESLNPELFKRGLRTQALGIIDLDIALQRFVWHNRHHISQIRGFISRLV